MNWLNPHLSQQNGEPTLLFKAMAVFLLIDGLGFIVGSFQSPNIYTAVVDDGDPLLAVTCVGWAFGVWMAYPALAAFRREILVSGATAQLIEAVHISAAKQGHLRKVQKLVQNLQYIFLFVSTAGFGFVAVVGKGLHSPAFNRVSAVSS